MSNCNDTPFRFYYFHSTHWDREWYNPFQVFRRNLTDMCEHLLTVLEEQKDFHFTFDGQTIVLQDIAELRPSLKEPLQKVISAGRLDVGPWYVMPDEFLVSAESIIRNFFAGRKLAEAFGHAPWDVCYVCDIFGHIAQMPQIANGFGLKGLVLWRGLPEDSGPFVLWESPDGCRMKTIRLYPNVGYGAFVAVRGKVNRPIAEEDFKQNLQKHMEKTSWHWGDSCFLLSDAIDHAWACRQRNELFRWIRELYPEAEILPDNFSLMFQNEFSRRDKQYPVYRGELLQCADKYNGHLISAVLSSRYDIKQSNDLCRDRLELLVEPEYVMRRAAGEKLSLEPLEYLWKLYLQNHAHDSICGCSIDAVHRAVMTRYEEANTLADALAGDFCMEDIRHLTGSGCEVVFDPHAWVHESEPSPAFDAEDGCYKLRIFNPLPYWVKEEKELRLAFPAKNIYPAQQQDTIAGFGYEQNNSFEIFCKGEKIPFAISSVEKKRQWRFYRSEGMLRDFYNIVLPLELAPCAWTTLEIRPASAPVRFFGSLLTGACSAENGKLRIEIAPDGSYTLYDLVNDRVYPGQNNYRIDRDMGDGWNQVSPVGMPVAVSSSSAEIRIIHDSPLRAEFEIIRTFMLPQELVWQGRISGQYGGVTLSENIVPFRIRTRIVLNAGAGQLKIRTDIDNNLRDARVRLVVPSGIEGKHFVSQSGAILQRNPGREHGNASVNYLEVEQYGKNFDGLIGKRDEYGGIALLAPSGLHEAGEYPEKGNPLFVTLFRAFRRTVGTDGEQDGQLQKKLHFEYALYSFGSSVSYAELYRQLQKNRVEIPHYMIAEASVSGGIDSLPFMQLQGDLVLSALKPAENGNPAEFIFRCWNLSDETVAGEAVFAVPFRKAELCRLDETVETLICQESDRVPLKVNPWKMYTVKVSLK